MNFFKKHKKGLIILLIIAAVVTGIVIWFKSAFNKGMNMLNAAMSNEVAEAQRRDIVSVVSATGKITSIDSKNVTTTATGAKVLEVKVVEGDEVKAGDVIAILDASSYEDNLKTLEDNLANSKKSSNLSISSAKRQLDEAVTSSNASNDKVNTQVADLEKKLEEYKDLRDQSLGIYEQAVKNRVAAEAAYKQALTLQSTLAGQIGDISGDDVSSNEQRAALETQLAAVNVTALLNTYNACVADEQTRLSNYNMLAGQYESTESSLKTLKDTRDETKRVNDASVAARQDALSSARISSNSASSSVESQIDAVKEQIENCTVTAPIDGVVTSLAISEGAVL